MKHHPDLSAHGKTDSVPGHEDLQRSFHRSVLSATALLLSSNVEDRDLIRSSSPSMSRLSTIVPALEG
jgi:hypothetical protein